MNDERRRRIEWGLEDLRASVAGAGACALEEVDVARHLERAAHAGFVRCVQSARSAGHSWDSIAERVPSFPQVYGPDAGQELFEWLAPPSRFGASSVYWRCGDCEGLVVDRGPYGGHPADTEQGHADDCGRLRCDVERHVAGLSEQPSCEIGTDSVVDLGWPGSLDLGHGPELG